MGFFLSHIKPEGNTAKQKRTHFVSYQQTLAAAVEDLATETQNKQRISLKVGATGAISKTATTMDVGMNEPSPRTDKSSGEEDESGDSSSSASEGSDSGMEAEHGDESEDDTEGESEVIKDFCTHQKMCTSTEECIIYRTRIKQENVRLNMKLKRLRSEQKTLVEKRRALSILKQKINVESKIARLEQVLTWMYKAKKIMSAGQAGGQVQNDGQQPSTVAGSSNDMGCLEEKSDH